MTSDLKKIMEWHLQQARTNKAQREFHTWAATMIAKTLETK